MNATILLLPLGGLIAGMLAATFIYTVEQPVFESTAICRLIRPEDSPKDIPHREWLHTEAIALTSAANFEQLARQLNLENEWKLSRSECVTRLQKSLYVKIDPDTSLIRITSQGEKPVEIATLVNAAISARETAVNAALQQDLTLQRYAVEARTTALRHSIASRRAALIAAKPSELPEAGESDEILTNAQLAPDLEPLRQAWLSEKRQLAWTEEKMDTLASQSPSRIYAEILQKAAPVLEPISPRWTGRAVTWSATGAGAGLAAGLGLLALRRRLPQEETPAAIPAIHATDY